MEKRLSRYHRSAAIIPVAVLALILLGPFRVLATDFGEVSVKVELITYGGTRNGYEEYRATIVNRSPNRAHRVTLIAPESHSRSGGARIIELRRTVEVAALSTARVSLFLPPLELDGADFSVTIDDERQKESVVAEAGRTGAWAHRTGEDLHILVSQNVSKSGLMNESAVEEGFKDERGLNVAYLPYEFPSNEWSSNWIGYSRFDGVILTADELRTMPEDVRTALWRYMECGGSLLVLGSWEVPEQWRERRQAISVEDPESETEGEDEASAKSSAGAKSPSPPAAVTNVLEFTIDKRGRARALASTTSTSKNDLEVYYIGFGALIVTGSVDPKQINAGQWREIKTIWHYSRLGEHFGSTIADINREFPVIEKTGVPVRGLFVLMILFVVVIGPVNMLWLSRSRRKIWLLWTVPAISLSTCLAVSAFAIFSEGLGATSRTAAITVLDETSHHAATIGLMAFYSPITPGEGMHFGYETELIPQIASRYWGSSWGDGVGRKIDWTTDQHLVSGWITARVPAFFIFRKNETRRERLSVRQESDGSITAVNGLGAEILKLQWADSAGNLYTAANIVAGAQSKLTPINLRAEGYGYRLRNIFMVSPYRPAEGWLKWFEEPAPETNLKDIFMPNSYLATLAAAPFVEEGLPDVRTKRMKSMVYGIQAASQIVSKR